MFVEMAAIVQNDVKGPVIANHPGQKLGIHLTALQDRHALAQIDILALNIHTDNLRLRKKVAPGGQEIPAQNGIAISPNPDFQHAQGAITEMLQQVEIDRRIVMYTEFVGPVQDCQAGQVIDHSTLLMSRGQNE